MSFLERLRRWASRSDKPPRLSVEDMARQIAANTSREHCPPPPTHRYVIFFTARSGSTWLTDVLKSSEGLGRPGEFFNPNRIPRQCERLGIAALESYPSLIQCYRKDRSSNVFGTEITWPQYTFLLPKVDVMSAFPQQETTFFTLRRENLLLQAISTYKASKTGIFGPNTNPENKTPEEIDASVTYDEQALKLGVMSIVSQERQTDELLKARGIAPLRLTYERMMKAGPERAAQFFRDALPVHFGDAPAPVMPERQKIATSLNDEWSERFMRGNAALLDELTRQRNLASDI